MVFVKNIPEISIDGIISGNAMSVYEVLIKLADYINLIGNKDMIIYFYLLKKQNL